MKDLTSLRKIAQNEPSHRWGQWTAEEDDWEGFVVFANDGLPGQSVVANGIRQGHDEGKATATFIATFNPETVLALLSRLEQAEENLESALEANKRWAHRSSRETSELFKANNAIRRVEALRDAMDREGCQTGEVIRIQDALDGDTRG